MPTARDRIGVEIGATKLQVVRGRTTGEILDVCRLPANSRGGAAAIVNQIMAEVAKQLTAGPVESIVVGFGGPVDTKSGIVLTSHQVDGWDNFPLARQLSQQFGVPCWLINDSDAAALAEAVCGAGKGQPTVFYTNIGSGIGAGYVRDGRLFQGRYGAMEFGHTWAYSTLESRVDRLEHLCSGWGIARRYARHLGSLGEAEAANRDRTAQDASIVVTRWLEGDLLAGTIMKDMMDTFGRALSSVIALLNPEKIVVGGGLSLVGEPLLEGIRQAIRKYQFAPFQDNWTLSVAELGEMCVPVGACVFDGW